MRHLQWRCWCKIRHSPKERCHASHVRPAILALSTPASWPGTAARCIHLDSNQSFGTRSIQTSERANRTVATSPRCPKSSITVYAGLQPICSWRARSPQHLQTQQPTPGNYEFVLPPYNCKGLLCNDSICTHGDVHVVTENVLLTQNVLLRSKDAHLHISDRINHKIHLTPSDHTQYLTHGWSCNACCKMLKSTEAPLACVDYLCWLPAHLSWGVMSSESTPALPDANSSIATWRCVNTRDLSLFSTCTFDKYASCLLLTDAHCSRLGGITAVTPCHIPWSCLLFYPLSTPLVWSLASRLALKKTSSPA